MTGANLCRSDEGPKYWPRVAGAIIGAVACIALAQGESAAQATKEPYLIGLSGQLTGPLSAFYVGQAEGLRVYFDQLNANGGINGHPVKVELRDNRGDPAIAASDAQAFIDGKVLVASLSSASNTVPGWAQAITRSDLPSVNTTFCYGPSVPGGGPKLATNYFCAGVTGIADAYAILEAFKTAVAPKLGPQPRLAYGSTNAPGNVAVFTRMLRPLLEKDGVQKDGYLAAVPFSTTDYSPAARAIIASGAQAVIVYAPNEIAIQYIRALRAAQFNGPIVSVLTGTESSFAGLKDPNLTLALNNSLISEGRPIHKKIEAAAKKYGATAPPEDMLNGWLMAMAIEKGLTACGFPCSRSKLVDIFNQLELKGQDVSDLYGDALVWTREAHHTTSKRYRIFRWSEDQKKLAPVGDPFTVTDPGLVFPKL